MGIELGTQLFETFLADTLPFGSELITSSILVMLTLLIITRDRERWGQIALPVVIGWQVAGIRPHIFLYIITAIIFVVTNLSFRTTATIISALKKQEPILRQQYQEQRKKIKDAARKITDEIKKERIKTQASKEIHSNGGQE